MRRPPLPLSFLTNAILSVDNRRLLRNQCKLQAEVVGDCGQLSLHTIQTNLPVSIPDRPSRSIDSCNARPGTIGALHAIKLTSIDIAYSQVGKIEILGGPCRLDRLIACQSLAKKCQLKSEVAALRRLQVSGVVPPFGLKFRMSKVVAWKLVVVPGQCNPVLRPRKATHEHEGGKPPSTPH